MDQTAIVLIVITNVFLVIILGFLAFLLFKMFKTSHPPAQVDLKNEHFHPVALERLREVEKTKYKPIDRYCPNHPQEPGEVMCAICDHVYCRQCIKPFKAMHLCKEHLPLVMGSDWVEVLTLKTSTVNPELGVQLYDRKKELFQHENIPTYIETHYKINVDQDFIETYLVMFSMPEHLESLQKKLNP